MLGNRVPGLDTEWLLAYFPQFFFNLVEKNLLIV